MSMKIGRWEGNEIIYTIDVNGNSVNLMEDFDFTMDILGANMVVSGMVVTEAAVPDMTVLISAGIAKDFTVGTFLIGEALVGVVTASDPINDRRDIIEVRRLIDNISPATRQFKDPETEDITESTIDTEVQYITEIKVLAGTPGTGLSLAVETGWIKIAEILVPAASTTVVDANIYNVDAEKEGVNNTNWTTTMASIHRNGTISEMKTKIIDNEAAAALNTTHRSSDGKNHSDVVLNNTHRGSDGSDHTFIDQDLKTTASPIFENVGALKKINKIYSWSTSATENTVFDALSPYLILGIESLASGTTGIGNILSIKLNTATTIEISSTTTIGVITVITITDGDPTTMDNGGGISF